MTYPSPAEFDKLIRDRPLDKVAKDYIFSGSAYGGTPFVFRHRPGAMQRLADHLKEGLGIAPSDMTVIGSGKIGFSLSPDRYPQPFRRSSDLDVLIVHEGLFDRIWYGLLEWNYPRRGILLGQEYLWARHRWEEVFWGWLRPASISLGSVSPLPQGLLGLRDLGMRWFEAFQTLSLHVEYPEFATRKVTGRLYRTWQHALMSQVDGLARLKGMPGFAKKGD